MIYDIGVKTKSGTFYVVRADGSGFTARDHNKRWAPDPTNDGAQINKEEIYRLNESDIAPNGPFTGNQLDYHTQQGTQRGLLMGGKTINEIVDTITGVKKIIL
ncbi:MAG: hypothetical protein KAJ24_05930 [Candidatus Aenigmarchaeota archaeon]|nr:hypothetical protein [Candidatus Aenigmarchaeota archaeon]